MNINYKVSLFLKQNIISKHMVIIWGRTQWFSKIVLILLRFYFYHILILLICVYTYVYVFSHLFYILTFNVYEL